MIDVRGKNVVVTGVIAGETRQTAEAKLTAAGATVQKGVSVTTDVLVVGAKVGAVKTRKAAELGVQVVPWDELWSPSPRVRLSAGPVRKLSVDDLGLRPPARIVAPMLAKAGELPTGDGWLYEVKWDGYRCVTTIRDGQVIAMQSRSGKTDYREQFPAVAKELEGIADCVLDGELLTENGGRYVVFDVIEMLGSDLRGFPLEVRRTALGELIEEVRSPRLGVSPAFCHGDALLEYVRRNALEGIVAKRSGSVYEEGRRSGAWVKVKVRCEQEFVVVGWTPGEGELAGHAGAFLLAVNDDGGLRFAGKVGTGLTVAEWDAIVDLLVPLSRQPEKLTIPHGAIAGPELRSVQWVVPDTVVQVAFQRWTEDGRLWHPSLLGVRDDKDAGDVVREAVTA